MLATKNDVPEKTRQNVVNLLQKRLADAIDLLLHAKHAHWNVRGPHFIGLHKLFDKIHEEIEDSVDLIAERITQFGGIAEGTCGAAAEGSSLPDYPLNITDGMDHVEAFSNSLSAFAKAVRQGIDQALVWQDVGTADILTQISRNVDKNLWFVEAHLAGEKAKAKAKVA